MTNNNKLVLSLRSISLDIPLYNSMNRSLKRSIMSPLSKINTHKEVPSVSVLRDISLDFFAGSRVALLGRNGSGKSSFLRVVSGIYSPTAGTITKSVNIVPMINKAFLSSIELPGSVAIKAHYLYANSSLDGFEEFYNSVLSFSGIGEFIHLPIKTYSEGMCQRLLFSILTEISHDALAVDESFGTGDKEFQAKSELRLNQFFCDTRLLFLASHSNDMLRQFCNMGVVFKDGGVVYSGKIEESIQYYEEDY